MRTGVSLSSIPVFSTEDRGTWAEVGESSGPVREKIEILYESMRWGSR